jgi:hypothetical protein
MNKSSWDLKHEISLLTKNKNQELRNEIDKYIRKYDTYSGQIKIADTLYRLYLEYIIKNINNDNLLIEIRKLNR